MRRGKRRYLQRHLEPRVGLTPRLLWRLGAGTRIFLYLLAGGVPRLGVHLEKDEITSIYLQSTVARISGQGRELGSLVKALFDDACASLLDRRRVRHRFTLRVRYRNLADALSAAGRGGGGRADNSR